MWRELRDLAVLTRICGISTLDEAEGLFGEFYPGEDLNATAVATVEAAFGFDVGSVTVERIAL